MKSERFSAVLKWGVGPVVVLAIAGAIGRAHARGGDFAEAVAALSETERKDLESAPALAVANATWALGNLESVKRVLKAELDRLPETEGHARARTTLRMAIADSNPDGQAALFALTCTYDERMCGRLREAAEHEARARLVPPGNAVPLSLLGGHP
ncbi:MAG: hypothetical protein DIU78_000650 [Pseudomonadota bacterium]|nr:MAG: hypothetical protein DIU78_12890 [Pseudomonadota bacterium]